MDKRILSNALLGTARQPFQPSTFSASEEGLGDFMQSLAGENSEEALLGAAAAGFLFERAGVTLPVDPRPLLPPAPAEKLQLCSARSRQHLNRLLHGRHSEILQEWLAALARAGKRLPAEKLPEMFGLMESQPDLAPLIEPVLGERGRWLAVQNPPWTLYAGLDLEAARENWETGSKASRVAFLKRLRASDSDQARQLLQETWASEGADQRAALLGVFERNLSLADEPFLEEKLDDRSKEVRRVAAELLARLPGSALVGRMMARANWAIKYNPAKKGFLNIGLKKAKSVFQVAPFDTADSSMLRDGIEPKSGFQTMGDKANILYEIIAAIPPGYWTQRWQAQPLDLIKEAANSEWAGALLLGWRHAIQRYEAGDWSEAFIRHWLEMKDRDTQPDYFLPIYNGLAYPQFDKLVEKALAMDSEPLYDRHPATPLLNGYKRGGNWRPELVRAVVKSIKRRINSNVTYQWKVQKGVLHELALHAPPNMTDELAEGWPEDSPNWPGWARDVQEFLSLLELRQEMLKEINS